MVMTTSRNQNCKTVWCIELGAKGDREQECDDFRWHLRLRAGVGSVDLSLERRAAAERAATFGAFESVALPGSD